MSDPVALVCVRGAEPGDASARRWRRRAPATHSVRVAVGPMARPLPSPPRFAGMRRVLAALLLGGAGWAGASTLVASSGDSAFSRQIGSGCEELEPCLSLEADAERRMDACSLFCGRAAAEHAAARQMRFRAEERRRVRDHYRERERSEQVERERERAQRQSEWQRARAARAEEATRERQHQLELERLRQEHLDRRAAEERQRHLRYFTALGPEGRALRLKRCLERNHERCDALALDLLDAARDDEERRRLAEANEGVVRRASKPNGTPIAKAEAALEETSSANSAAAAPPPAADDATPPSS